MVKIHHRDAVAQPSTMQALAHYWLEKYDWRECAARLNVLPQFITEIDRLDIQLHPRVRVHP